MPAAGGEMTTSEVVRRLRASRAELLAAIDRLGPGASTIPVTEPGGWTAKDVLAHLIHYAGQIAFGLGAPLTPPAYVVEVTDRLSGQEWNERAVAHWSTVSMEDVRAEFTRVTDHVIERAALRSDDEMNRTDLIPWVEPRPLWRFVGGDTFLHEWPAHTAQILAAAPTARP